MTVAPLIANGVLITGISGAEFGIRGFIDGWDPETGKQLWRRYTIPARGEKGNETWPQDNDAWKIGGGSSLDHRLLRSRARPRSTGAPAMPAPWAVAAAPGRQPLHRPRCWRCGRRPARSSGTTSSRPTTPYDYDANWELILADIDVDGQQAQGADAAQPQRLPLRARPHQRQADLGQAVREGQLGERTSTWRPAGRSRPKSRKKLRAGEQIELWPRTRGGKNWPHAAFNPETGLLYANTMHQRRMYKHLPAEAARGRPALSCASRTCRRRSTGRADRPHRRDRSADRQAEVARAAHRSSGSGRRCWRPAAGCCSPARRPASSSRSTPRPARRCGSSRPAPASTRSRSPTRTTAGNTSRCCPASAASVLEHRARAAQGNVPPGGSVWTFALMPD